MQAPHGSSWPNPPHPPKARHMPWWGIVLVGLACFLFGFGCGTTASKSQVSAAPAVVQPQIAPIPQPAALPTAALPTAAPTVDGVTNGIYKVGDEVAVGEYRSSGAQPDGIIPCYVHVKRGERYLLQKVANDGQVRITIPSAWVGAELDIRGCQPFAKIG